MLVEWDPFFAGSEKPLSQPANRQPRFHVAYSSSSPSLSSGLGTDPSPAVLQLLGPPSVLIYTAFMWGTVVELFLLTPGEYMQEPQDTGNESAEGFHSDLF